MKFRLQQHYPGVDPDAVARAYADPALYASFTDLPRAGRPVVLGHEVRDGAVELRIRWSFTAPLSSAARAVIDPDRLSWVETTVHDLPARRASFTMAADHYADRFACRGTYAFGADPDGAGTVRTVEGELKIRAPLVARAVEGAIASGLEEQLAGEVPAVLEFLRVGA